MGRGKRGNVVQGLILNFFFVPVFCETAKFNSRLIDAGEKECEECSGSLGGGEDM